MLGSFTIKSWVKKEKTEMGDHDCNEKCQKEKKSGRRQWADTAIPPEGTRSSGGLKHAKLGQKKADGEKRESSSKGTKKEKKRTKKNPNKVVDRFRRDEGEKRLHGKRFTPWKVSWRQTRRWRRGSRKEGPMEKQPA